MALHNLVERLTTLGWAVACPVTPLMATVEKLLNQYPPQQPVAEKMLTWWHDTWRHRLARMGMVAHMLWETMLALLSFLGEVMVAYGRLALQPWRFPLRETSANVYRAGVRAVPIIALTTFLIGIVLAYQSITQLARFGAQIYTVNLLGLGILREVGVLITAVVVAGRSGSAFTAELGIMTLNEEISALRVIGLDPLRTLVIPRVTALMVALPALTLLANLVALAGGAVIMASLMDIALAQYLSQLAKAISAQHFWLGMLKAPFFGFVIGCVACYEGLSTAPSAQSVGLHTTRSVVRGLFLVIILDAVFSIIYATLGV